jgi:PAS domain S-box-containing protein
MADRSDSPDPPAAATLAALRASEERWRSVIAALGEGIVVHDAGGAIVACNASAERLLGLTVDQMVGRTSLDPRWRAIREDGSAFPGQEHPAMVTLRTGQPQREVVMGAHKPDGSLTWISINTQPMMEPGAAKPKAVVASFVDLTRWKEAEARLRASEERLRFAFQAARLGAWDWDLRTGVIAWEGEHARLLGLEPGDFDGRYETFARQVHPEDLPQIEREIEHARATGADYIGEFRALWPDGGIHWIRGHGRFIYDADGRPERMLGIVQETTERKRAETTLRLLAEAGAVLAHSLDEATTLDSLARLLTPALADSCTIDVIEPDGRLRQVVSKTDDPRIGEHVRAIHQRYPRSIDGPHPAAVVARTGRSLLVPEITDEWLCSYAPDEGYVTLVRSQGLRSALIVPLVARGRTLGTLMLVTAGSGRRYGPNDLQLAEQVAQRAALAVDNARLHAIEQVARDEAEAAARQREEFLGVVAHELRTPLSTIKGYAQVLARSIGQPAPERERQRLAADQLLAQIGRFETLISDLLDIARIQQGRLDLRPRQCDLAALAATVLGRFEQAPERTERHTLRLDAPAPVVGFWDPARLEQVLTNLISNALKYSPDGGEVRVSVAAVEAEAALAVADHGMGIAPSDRANLFQPFRRGVSVRGVFKGEGLGLYITAQIVARHGGAIAVESRPGEGSTFTIRLPLDAVRAV